MLVGSNTCDDAAVYRITDEIALVFTVDYFTPVVDDAYDFGRIAAANSLSDAYAMGARPVLALNVVGFPSRELPLDLLSEILRGGSDVAQAAGVSIAGGHSIDDAEPKYGMAVIGLAHPNEIVRNVGARPGDVLILTKPIGSGIIATAIKRDRASADMIETAVTVMATLNRDAAEVMQRVGVRAGTDVTGFGLLGHLREMAEGSGVGAIVRAGSVPVMSGVAALAAEDVVPGGTKRNYDYLSGTVDWDSSIGEPQRMVLCDAQTSGGLLMAVTPEKASAMIAGLEAAGTLAAARVGEITEGPVGRIAVVP